MMTFQARMQVKPGKGPDFIRLANELTQIVRESKPETTACEFFKLRDGSLSANFSIR